MTSLQTSLYITGIYSAYIAGFIFLRSHSGDKLPASEGISFHFPKITLVLLLAIGIPTTLQFFFPTLLLLFQRDYAKFAQGDWWRVITPLFFQDGGAAGAIFNLVSLFFISIVAEHLWNNWQLLIIFFVGGIFGEVIAFSWQPIGAGNSIANFSVAASVATACLMRNATKPVKVAAILALAADIILIMMRDIHGAAAIFGMILAVIFGTQRKVS